jgi:hypothetical protein
MSSFASIKCRETRFIDMRSNKSGQATMDLSCMALEQLQFEVSIELKITKNSLAIMRIQEMSTTKVRVRREDRRLKMVKRFVLKWIQEIGRSLGKSKEKNKLRSL